MKKHSSRALKLLYEIFTLKQSYDIPNSTSKIEISALIENLSNECF